MKNHYQVQVLLFLRLYRQQFNLQLKPSFLLTRIKYNICERHTTQIYNSITTNIMLFDLYSIYYQTTEVLLKNSKVLLGINQKVFTKRFTKRFTKD